MKVNFTLVLLALSLFALGQEKTSKINFEKKLNWQQVKEKAKKEGKYIFFDCYATWCLPCKEMDKNVFSNDVVANVVNENFLAIKLQFDKTDADIENVREWHRVAEQIEGRYSVNAFPTFLFFDSTGQPVHKAVGYKTVEEFIATLDDARNPSRQYYKILSNYQAGSIDTSELKGLANLFFNSDRGLAGKLASDYLSRITFQDYLESSNLKFIARFKGNKEVKRVVLPSLQKIKSIALVKDSNVLMLLSFYPTDSIVQRIVSKYLLSLSTRQLLLKENLTLLAAFQDLIFSSDYFFNLFFLNEGKVDNILGVKGKSESIIDIVLYNKIIAPEMSKMDSTDQDINWEMVFKRVKNKTNDLYAKRNIINAKVKWYSHKTKIAEKKNGGNNPWGVKFSKAFAEKLERFGVDTSGEGRMAANTGNNLEYSIYRYCTDEKTLTKAIEWLGKVMISQPGFDFGYVYAGLLYKLGRVKDGIEWQKVTIQNLVGQLCESNKDFKSDKYYRIMLEILEKMKRGEPSSNIIYWAEQ